MVVATVLPGLIWLSCQHRENFGPAMLTRSTLAAILILTMSTLEDDMRNYLTNHIRIAWHSSESLTVTAALMLGAFLAFGAGILSDDRTITGAPAWLKPAKFAISSAIYAATLAWLFRYIFAWPRFVRAMGKIVSSVLIMEVGVIALQAARGTTSHFNATTPLDRAISIVMLTAIAFLWLASAGILVALFRHRSRSAWDWSLRLGLLISLLGSGAGGLMLRPTPEQMKELRAGRVSTVGAHTVGAPDGGAGLPGVNWSTGHGDLRIPHFFGIHALQAVPFLGWLFTRRRRANQLVTVILVAGSYLSLSVILTWQALRGQLLIHPDGATLLALGLWLGSTAPAFVFLRDAKASNRVLAAWR